MKALEVRLPESVTDTTLKKINEGRFSLLYRGAGVAKVTFSTNNVVTVSLLNKKGLLLTNENDTIGVTAKTVSGNVTFYVKLTGDDYLCFDYASYVSELGSSSTEFITTTTTAPQINSNLGDFSDFVNLTRINCNSPMLKGDISELTTIIRLGVLNINTSSQIYGYIGVLAALVDLTAIGLSNTRVGGNLSSLAAKANLASLSISYTQVVGSLLSLKNTAVNNLTIPGCSITGDVNDLPNTLAYFTAYDITSGIVYTGGQAAKFTTLDRFYLNHVALTTSQIDNLLISLSNSNWTGTKILVVKGTRSGVSDAAITTLQGKGVTVTINS